MFSVLSHSDSVDTVDSVGPASRKERPRPPSVHSVAKCQRAAGDRPPSGIAAETLGFSPGVRPSVHSVNTVPRGSGGEAASPAKVATDTLTLRDTVAPTVAGDPEERAAIIAEGAGVPRAWA